MIFPMAGENALTKYNDIRNKLQSVSDDVKELALAANNLSMFKPTKNLDRICEECGKQATYNKAYGKWINLYAFMVGIGSMIVHSLNNIIEIHFCSKQCYKKYMLKKIDTILTDAQKAHKDSIKCRKEAQARGEDVW